MHKLITKTIKTAITVLTAVLLAGCNTAKMESPIQPQGALVELSISASEMQTKAMDETAIKSVRIFAFDNTGKLAGHIYKDSPAAGEKLHMAIFVPANQPTATLDFYAVANEGAMYHGDSALSLSDNMTINELKNLVYSSLITSYDAMPLYGVIEDQVLTLGSDFHVEDEHIALKVEETVAVDLVRSLAKIGVYAAAIEGVTENPIVKSITLKSSGRRDISYLFPAGDDASLKARDANIISLAQDRVFDLVADGKDVLSNEGKVAKRLAAQNTDKNADVTDFYTEVLSPFYLAEVPHGSNDWSLAADPSGRPVVLVLNYVLKEGDVDRYAEINLPEIKRNSFYQVRCLIKANGQILINVSVDSWKEGEDWNLSFDFPTHLSPLLATSSYNSGTGMYKEHTNGTEATMYFTGTESTPGENGAFSVDFNMSYPIDGGIWTPSLSGVSNDDFEIRLYKRGTSEEITSHAVTVTESNKDTWYTIKVVPLKSSNIGKKATLSISYTPIYTGTDYSYLLQINGGEESNLAWTEKSPVAGDSYEASTVDIVITQVDAPLSGL
jgi:hypothetical protein